MDEQSKKKEKTEFLSRREWDELLEKSPQDALPPDESTLLELVRLMREPKKKGLPLSVIVVAENHQRSIKRCLESVLWANEIVMVSGRSKDETLRIAKDPEAPWSRKLRVLEVASAKTEKLERDGIKKATHEWVFVLMGDEACSPELAQSLQKKLSHEGGPDCDSYRIRKGRPARSEEKYVARFFKKSGDATLTSQLKPAEKDLINEPIE